MSPTPTKAGDDPPAAATRGRRALLDAAIRENYAHLCDSALAVITKRYRGVGGEAQRIDMAVDAVHEAVRRALAKAESFDPARPARPWLMGYVLKVIAESVRDADRRRRREGGMTWGELIERLVGVAAGPSWPDGPSDDLRRLGVAWAALDDDQREILSLRYRKGLDAEELARVIGAPSAGAARVRLYRALKAMRAAFGAAGGGEEVNR